MLVHDNWPGNVSINDWLVNWSFWHDPIGSYHEGLITACFVFSQSFVPILRSDRSRAQSGQLADCIIDWVFLCALFAPIVSNHSNHCLLYVTSSMSSCLCQITRECVQVKVRGILLHYSALFRLLHRLDVDADGAVTAQAA